MKAILIKPGGETIEVSPANGRSFKLEELYKWVECDTIDIVSLASGDSMVVDDNGIANELKPNPLATAMYQENRMKPEEALEYYKKNYPGFAVISGGNQEQIIYGNALVCNKRMIK